MNLFKGMQLAFKSQALSISAILRRLFCYYFRNTDSSQTSPANIVDKIDLPFPTASGSGAAE